MRTSKTVNNVKYDYYWDGDKLTGQTWQGNTLYFYYDKDGNPIGFDLNNNNYYYVTNLQGDIIAILSSSNGLLAEYEYDAWGNCTILYDTNDIADINPLRYRGYYYDTDTNLYYLQSRYYDSNIGRFINADDAEMITEEQNDNILQYNLFTYTFGNFINYTDAYGLSPVRNVSNSVKYDRKKVKKYIKQWVYKRNNAFIDCKKNDCTNFVSQCLCAGGLRMYYNWRCTKKRRGKGFDYTHSWTLAEGLFDHIRQNLSDTTCFFASKYSQVKNKISKLDAGDLLFFYKKASKKISHASVINFIKNGIVYYAQHSDDYYQKNLKDLMKQNKYQIYVVHISNYVRWRDLR